MGKINTLFLCSFLCLSLNLSNAQLPQGFSNELVSDDLFRSLAFTFLPSGEILILEKDGQIKIGGPINTIPITLTNFMTIPNIDPSGEHGLIQIALDPNFETNGYFYLYYSASEDSKNRISRFRDLGDPVSRLNSETIIWEATDPFQGCCHTGGTLDFAQDGTLLLATGDDFSNLTSQDLGHSNGKVHRFNTDGSIPTDNPYYDTTPGDYNANGVLKSIYASGLRNPFRGKFDDQLNTLIIGEVGGNNQNFAWEDIHSIALGQGGANFGWPACGDGSTGREANGDCTNPAYTDPVFTYPHNGSGAAIIGGVFYRDFEYPSEYQNKYFYGDYTQNWIKYIEFDNNLNAISDITFDNNPGLVLDFEVGPDGNLYYVRVLTAAGTNIGTGEIRRYVFNDPNNSPPSCDNVTSSTTSGPTAPLSVDFNATVSDDDGDTINYTWDFGDGNQATGVVPPSGIIPTTNHIYTTAGEKNARLFLTDQTANVACDAITIIVGQPPTAQILTPSNDSTFRGNDVLSFTGQATDPDGTINSNNIEWFISLKNGTSIHPRQGPDLGTSTTFTVPTNNHVPFVGDTGYIVSMIVTDSDGLTDTDTILLLPEKSTITLDSNPQGLTVLLDGVQKTTPFVFDELINFEFELKAENQCLNDNTYTFSSWSDGGAQVHQIAVPETNTQYTATYNANAGCIICGKAVDFDGTNDLLSLTNNVTLSGDFTIEFWANLDPNITNADQPLGNLATNQNINFFNNNVRLFIGTNVIVANSVTTANQWRHYAFVREGNTMKLFIDGVLDQSLTTTWTGNFSVSTLGTALTGTGYLEGQLDDIRLWNIARTNTEIADFYDKSIAPTINGLEAYWNFNEEDDAQQIPDLTGNGYDANLGSSAAVETNDPEIADSNLDIENDCINTPTCSDGLQNGNETGIDCGGSFCEPCVIVCDKAADFDGTNDILTVVNNVVLSGDFTIEFWANLDPTITNADQPMGNGSNQNINFFQSRIRLYQQGNVPQDPIIANFVTPPNQWHHYAFVRNGNNLKILIDGAIDNSITTAWNSDYTVNTIGTSLTAVGYTEGQLDEIRLWNIARSDTDIATFHDKSIEPSTPGLEAYWSFNADNSTQQILDLTGNPHNLVRGATSATEANDPVIIDSSLSIENDCEVTYVYDNGWSPSDPNGISKLSHTIIIENGDTSIINDTYCKDITVRAGASLTVNSGAELTTNIGMTLESSSTSYSSLLLDGIINGNVIYKRHVNNAAAPNTTTTGNDLISPPLNGQTFGDFRAVNSNILSGNINGETAYLFGPFNPSSLAYINYTANDDTSILNAGVGYRSGSTDGMTYTFTGSIETSNVTVPIVSGGTTNWNLIGNPYPSYINAEAFLNNMINSGLIDENAVGIYGYDGTAQDGWTIINLATTTANTVITPGQGFFVNALSSGNITFTPAMRATGNSDDFILGRSSNNISFLRLKAASNTYNYSCDFYFNDNASASLDIGYDAAVWNNTPPNFSIYSHLVEDDTGIAFAIQALNNSDISNTIVPLGVNANMGESLTISIEETTLPSSIDVYLEDRIQNTFTLLNTQNYQITPSTNLEGIGRYYLHFSEEVLSTNNSELELIRIFANNNQKTIDIKGLTSEKSIFKLYDIQGRMLITTELEINILSQHIDVSTLNSGIYIVEINNSKGSKSKKVILK